MKPLPVIVFNTSNHEYGRTGQQCQCFALNIWARVYSRERPISYSSSEQMDTSQGGAPALAPRLRVCSRKRVSGQPSCHELDHWGLDEGEACLEVLCQTAVYAEPCKRPLDDPALRQPTQLGHVSTPRHRRRFPRSRAGYRLARLDVCRSGQDDH